MSDTPEPPNGDTPPVNPGYTPSIPGAYVPPPMPDQPAGGFVPPPPMSPQPGQVPPPMNSGRSSFPWKGCLIAFFIAFVIGAGGCVACTYLVYNVAKGPIDATNKFMKAYKTSDSARIDNLKCANSSPDQDLSNRVGLDLGQVKSYDFKDTHSDSANGVSTAVVNGTVVDSNGVSHSVTASLEKQSGWKVCAFVAGITTNTGSNNGFGNTSTTQF